MAELADALDSKSSGLTLVPVRVRPSAPHEIYGSSLEGPFLLSFKLFYAFILSLKIDIHNLLINLGIQNL